MNKVRLGLIFGITILIALVVGCQPQHQKQQIKHTTHVREYRQQNSNGNWVFWYVFYSNILTSNHVQSNVYYYSSPTRLTESQFSYITPTKVEGNQFPEELKETMNTVPPESDTSISDNYEPVEMYQQDQAEFEATYSEYESTQGSIDSGSSVDSSSSSSYDSGGSSDSGGGSVD